MDYDLEFPANSYRDEFFSISELYHENTKQWPFQSGEPVVDLNPFLWERMRRPFKVYTTAEKITLSKDFDVIPNSVEDVIQRRRSCRDFIHRTITLDELSRLLFFTTGITGHTDEPTSPFYRAAPSGGALYPLEVYPVVLNVASLERGIYHYNVREHTLELLQQGEYRSQLHEYTHHQDMLLSAAVVLIITAVFIRTRVKYGERGYRHILLEAGHMAQNTYLMATAMNLGAVTIGGFLDDEINQVIQIDGVDEAAVYLVVIGQVK